MVITNKSQGTANVGQSLQLGLSMSIQGLLSLHNIQSRNQFSEKMNVVDSFILQQHLLPVAGRMHCGRIRRGWDAWEGC